MGEMRVTVVTIVPAIENQETESHPRQLSGDVTRSQSRWKQTYN